MEVQKWSRRLGRRVCVVSLLHMAWPAPSAYATDPGIPYRTTLLRTEPARHNFGLLAQEEEKKKKKKLRKRGHSNATHDSHYLFGPSPIPMEGGSGLYQSHDLLMQSVYFTPVSGFTFGGGIQVASLITLGAQGSSGPIFHLRVNGGGPLGNGLYAGGFAMGMRLGPDQEINDTIKISSTMGIGGAQIGAGNEHFHVTVSAGVQVDQNGLEDRPVWGFAGLWHVGDRVAIITENWDLPLGPDRYRVYSYGARIKHRAMALDVAFAYNKEMADFFFLGVPVLGFSMKFGGDTVR